MPKLMQKQHFQIEANAEHKRNETEFNIELFWDYSRENNFFDDKRCGNSALSLYLFFTELLRVAKFHI